LGALDHMKFSISNQKRLSKTVIESPNWGSAIILAHHPLSADPVPGREPDNGGLHATT
jgi:hypothetical protein